MNLKWRIKEFYEKEYGVPDIKSENISRNMDRLIYNFFSGEYGKYIRLFDHMRNQQLQLSDDLAVLFLRGTEFPANKEFIKLIKGYQQNENEIQMFFTYHAQKEDVVAKRIIMGNRFIDKKYTRNFLKKALEHKLICEDKKLWKNPDTSIQHLRFLSTIANRLSYLEEDLDDKIALLEFNNIILQKKGDSTKAEYDGGFNFARRLFECNANLGVCYFEKGDIQESKKYMNYALDYLTDIESEIDQTKTNLLYPVHVCVDKLNEILIKNSGIFSEQLFTDKVFKIKNRLDRKFKKEEVLIA